MGLRNIADGPRPSTTITINGQSVAVRDLTWAEAQAVEDLFPYPIAPLGPDPRRGSQAPPIRRTDNPDFVRQSRDRFLKVTPVEIAIATDWTDGEGLTFMQVVPAKRGGWCVDARAWVEANLTEGDIIRISKAREALAAGPGGLAEAPGKD